MDAGETQKRLDALRRADLLFDSPLRDEHPYEFPDLPAYARSMPDFRPPRRRLRRWILAIDRRLDRILRSLTDDHFRLPARVIKAGDYLIFTSRCCLVDERVVPLIASRSRGQLADFLYGDSVHYSATDNANVWALRPGWSPERLLAHCYVGQVIAVRREVARAAGGRMRLRWLKPHARALELSRYAATHAHCSDILYAAPFHSRASISDAGAVDRHCRKSGIDATCELVPGTGTVRVARAAPVSSVCAIIPTRGTRATVWGRERALVVEAVRSLVANRGRHTLEIIVVPDGDTPREILEEVMEVGAGTVRVVPFAGEFNFAAKTNLGAIQTDAEFLLFVNDDTEIESPDVLDVLVGHLQDDGVGLVAPLLRFEDGTVQSAGHLLNPMPFDMYRGYAHNLSGGDNVLRVAREVSSVIAAFCMTRRDVFEQVGGLCTDFGRDYNDVDYALKLRSVGRRTVVTPHARCWHFESKSRTPGLETDAIARLGSRWRELLQSDPLGNEHLQPYEFIWKSDSPDKWSLDDALGYTAHWDGGEWTVLQGREDRYLHRTMFFPHKVSPR